MFKRFSTEQSVSSTSQVKNSVQRSVRSQLVEQYPTLEPIIDEIMPKKLMIIARCQDHIQLIVVNKEIIFFNHHDGPFFPTLRLLHKYPIIMPRMQVDKGAIKFILSGANIMCRGFTSKGGAIPTPLEANSPVAIYAEGKQHAIAVGLTKMSTADIVSINSDVGVETVHYLLDGLWQDHTID